MSTPTQSNEALLAAIEEKAAVENAALLADGEKKAAARRQAILAEAETQTAALREQTEKKAEALRRSARLTAGLTARKNTLAEKRRLIDEAYNQSLDALCALDDGEWSALVSRLIVGNCPPGETVLRVPAADAARYRSAPTGGKTLLEQLSDALTEKHGVPCFLRLDSAPAFFRGGVRILGQKSDVDASFEALLDELRETGEQEIAAFLFREAEYEPAGQSL